jgi:hypothetical protein
MKHSLCLVLAILFLDVSMLSAAPQEGQPFPKELRDPAFLRQLTWRADKRLENVFAGWRKFSSDEQIDDDQIIHHGAIIRILESNVLAVYATYKPEGDAHLVIQWSENTATVDCDALFTWAKETLGQPDQVVDLSSAGNIANLKADWLFGETRVRLVCIGGWIEGKYIPAVTLLTFNQRKRLAALKNPIQLECSSQERRIGGDDQTVREVPPMGFIIDPNDKELLRGKNKVPYEKQEKFTDEEVVAGFEEEKGTVQIRIDRVTASYMFTVRLKDGYGSEQWGKCVSVAPGKKF